MRQLFNYSECFFIFEYHFINFKFTAMSHEKAKEQTKVQERTNKKP